MKADGIFRRGSACQDDYIRPVKCPTNISLFPTIPTITRLLKPRLPTNNSVFLIVYPLSILPQQFAISSLRIASMHLNFGIVVLVVASPALTEDTIYTTGITGSAHAEITPAPQGPVNAVQVAGPITISVTNSFGE